MGFPARTARDLGVNVRRAKVDSREDMLGSGCGIESDQCEDSILGRRRGIFCSPANTPGNRSRTLAVLAPVSSRRRRFQLRAPSCPDERAADEVSESVSLSAATSATARKSGTQVRGGLCSDTRLPTTPVEEMARASFWR